MATVSPAVSSSKFGLSSIKTGGSELPPRIVVHGVEGFGKTSFGAMAPSPVFIQSRGETGLETLIDACQLPETAHFPEAQSWNDLKQALHVLIHEAHDFRTLVVDTINGLERLCHEFVCARDFNNDWGERGFQGFMRGYDVALSEWREFLGLLDELRAKRQMAIILLCHTKVTTFKNPEGADYDRFAPDMHHKTWGLTHKWADAVFFGNFFTIVNDDNGRSKRGKGKGGQQRVLYTVRHAAYDAKNRFGLPEEIDCGESAAEAYAAFEAAFFEARSQGYQRSGNEEEPQDAPAAATG